MRAIRDLMSEFSDETLGQCVMWIVAVILGVVGIVFGDLTWSALGLIVIAPGIGRG